MHNKRKYILSGGIVGAAGLLLAIVGVGSFNWVFADSSTGAPKFDIATTLLVVGGVIILTGIIVIVWSFFTD